MALITNLLPAPSRGGLSRCRWKKAQTKQHHPSKQPDKTPYNKKAREAAEESASRAGPGFQGAEP